MALTFLQLCQRAVRESGTVSGDAAPSTVVSQSGRLLKVVDWVKTAHDDLQSLHDDWLWLRGEFSGTLSEGSPRYTSSSFSLDRFTKWWTSLNSEARLYLYETSEGEGDEAPLTCIAWQEWLHRYGRGSGTLAAYRNRPTEYAVSPALELCFGPIPDDTGFTVRGEYQKSPLAFSANADVPEMPGGDAMHMLIVWMALIRLNQFDEALLSKEDCAERARDLLRRLEREQRPQIGLGGPRIKSGPLA